MIFLKTFLFADDTTLISLSDNPNLLKSATQNILHSAEKWFSSNKLKLNEDKTQHLTVSFKRETRPSGPIKLLGFYIDYTLTWTSHLKCLSKRLSTNLYLVRQLKKNSFSFA